jgi:hypothetical protein
MRLLTGVGAGKQRLRDAVGLALRSTITSLPRPASIQRLGERASARLRPAFSVLSPLSALRPASMQRLGEKASARLRLAFSAVPPLSVLCPTFADLMRVLWAELAAVRPVKGLQRIEGVDEVRTFMVETARVIFPALLRRLRPHWKAVTDAVPHYNRFKILIEKIKWMLRKNMEPQP